MGEKRNKNQVCFQLASLDLLESKMYFPSKSPGEIKKFNFKVQAKNYFKKDKKSVVVFVDASITSENTANKMAVVKVGYVYDIKNFDEFINQKNGKTAFPADFQKLIKIVSISTTRGIIYSQFRGTFLHEAILPIIDFKGLKTSELLG
jgi:hypothetical protein